MDLIDHIEIFKLQGPEQKKPFWVSHFIVPNANELLIKIKTKDGVEGFGMATSYTDITPIIKPFTNGLVGSNHGHESSAHRTFWRRILRNLTQEFLMKKSGVEKL